MSYLEKARELGQALAQTPEVKNLKAAEAAIYADPEAKAAFAEYQEKAQRLLSAQLLNKVVPEKDALALIDLKVRLMNKYPVIRTYFQEEQKFERLMATVNLTITTHIHGMPSADQLPIPDELKGLAQKLLDNISGGQSLPKMEIPKDFKLPPGIKFPPQ